MKQKISEVQALLENKKITLGEVSVHLMREFTIYQDIEYPESIDRDQ